MAHPTHRHLREQGVTTLKWHTQPIAISASGEGDELGMSFDTSWPLLETATENLHSTGYFTFNPKCLMMTNFFEKLILVNTHANVCIVAGGLTFEQIRFHVCEERRLGLRGSRVEYLVSVAEQVCLDMAWSETTKTCFLVTWPNSLLV